MPATAKNKTGKINREWHGQHRMPANATVQQRIEWHLEHAKHCNCRPMPEPLKQEIEKRKAAGQA